MFFWGKYIILQYNILKLLILKEYYYGILCLIRCYFIVYYAIVNLMDFLNIIAQC
jgi:hypothetical protein